MSMSYQTVLEECPGQASSSSYFLSQSMVNGSFFATLFSSSVALDTLDVVLDYTVVEQMMLAVSGVQEEMILIFYV